MIRSAFFEPNNPINFLHTTQEISNYLNSKTGFLWVSIEAATDEEILLILKETFNFHPLTIEDCQSSGYQVAKLDDFISYVFIIAHAIKPTRDFHQSDTLELNLCVGENFLVTCTTDSQMPPVEKTLDRVNKDFRLSNFGPDFLCHAVLVILVDEYMPLIDQMEDEIEWLEESVIEKPSPARWPDSWILNTASCPCDG